MPEELIPAFEPQHSEPERSTSLAEELGLDKVNLTPEPERAPLLPGEDANKQRQRPNPTEEKIPL